MGALLDWWEGLVFWRTPLTVLIIVLAAVFIRLILQFVIRRVVHSVVHGINRKQGVDDTHALASTPLNAVRIVQRTRTLGGVLSGIVSTIITVVATLLVITVIAPNAVGAFSLITAALGAGLGFGAQNIVKDVLNGLFMVIEDQLGVGDVVDLGPATGVVERVGIRITDIRDVNGTLWHVRNGEIVRVGNLSQGWARVIIDLAVPLNTDIDRAQNLILRTATTLATENKWSRMILEKPEVWGIESITQDAIVLRLVAKTRTTARDEVGRELRARLKHDLDEAGISLPSLHSVILSGFAGAGSVRGNRPPKTASNPVSNPKKSAKAPK